MTSLPRDINDIHGLNSRYKAFLIRADLTCIATILSLPVAAIQHRTRLSLDDVNKLLEVIIDSQLPPIKTVAEHLGYPFSSHSPVDDFVPEPECFSTGDGGFDGLLGGGIRLGAITEFVGTASSGKTNFCLQCSLHVQLPTLLGGMSGGTIYIDTESHFASERLLQLARYLHERVTQYSCGNEEHRNNYHSDAVDYMENVHVNSSSSFDDLEHTLRYFVPALIERCNVEASLHHKQPEPTQLNKTSPTQMDSQEIGEQSPSSSLSTIPLGRSSPPATPTSSTSESSLFDGEKDQHQDEERKEEPEQQHSQILPIKLLVLDSVAAPFRIGAEEMNYSRRSKNLVIIGDLLHYLATTYNIAIAVVNQVTDVVVENPNRKSPYTPQYQLNTNTFDIDGEGYDESSTLQPTSRYLYPNAGTGKNIENWPFDDMSYSLQSRFFSGQIGFTTDNENTNSNNDDSNNDISLSSEATICAPPSSSYTIFSPTANHRHSTYLSSKAATLGLAWTNCINSRIMLKRTRKRYGGDGGTGDYDVIVDHEEANGQLQEKSEQRGQSTAVRIASLVFSPFAPPASIEYLIESQGIRSI